MRIITCCSRSGSSFVCQLLHELGANFGEPDKLVKPDEWNKKGYFENRSINKINHELLNDDFLTEDDKNFAAFIMQYDHGKLNIFWQSLIKGYDEIKISPQPHSTLEMVLLRCAFLLNDNKPTKLEEKKKV